jgi:RHS repeat-associated protein
VGNRLTMREIEGPRTTYAYDAANQLVNEKRSGASAYNITYTYDAMGNRTLQNDGGQLTTYAYDQFNQLLNQTNPDGTLTTYSYDGAGNRTLEQTGTSLTTYTWDAQSRLSAIALSDGSSESYAYDYDGLRRQKVAGGTTTNFVWDGQNLMLEKDGAGVTQARYINRPDEGMYSPICQVRNAVLSYYDVDAQYSIRKLISSGAVTDTYTFTGFGELLASSGSTVNPFKFIGGYGYYSDAASRIYVRARYYDPVRGRWVSTDPIGFAAEDWNLFRYSSNEPLVHNDPTGLINCIECSSICSTGRSSALADLCDRCSRACTAPSFRPKLWNDLRPVIGIQTRNNCYSYACNKPYGHPAGGLPQPGYSKNLPFAAKTCKAILANAFVDGCAIPMPANKQCPPGLHRVQLYISPGKAPYPGWDQHWYRQDDNGYWSHKRGHLPAEDTDASGNKIVDPRQADRIYGRYNYSVYCGERCATNSFR